MYVKNPKKGIKKPRFEQEGIILALFSFVLYGKRGNPYTIRMFFLKKETLFSTLLSYQLSTLFSKDLLGFFPKIPTACFFFYNLRNMSKYKDRCQVIILLLWTLPQLGCYLVTGGESTPISAIWHVGR